MEFSMDNCDYFFTRPRRVLAAAAVLLVFCATACGQEKQTREEERSEIVPVRTVQVEREAFEETVSGIGSLESPEIVQIKPEINALVEQVHAPEGTDVQRGQLLYTLDAATIESELASARAALQLAEAELENATATHDRFRRLFASRTISREEYEERLTAFRTAQAEVQRLHAQVRLMKERLEDSTIRAAMDGVIAEHQVDPGDYVEAGETLVTLYSIDPLEISFRIAEAYMGLVQKGQRVHVNLTSGAIPAHQGEVSFVSPNIDQATRKFLVKARVDNSDKTLKPGAFARADVVLNVREGRPAVPERALVSRRKGYALFVVEDGKAMRRDVEIGLRRPGLVEIVAGVDIGEDVVTAGQMRLEDGARVRVEEKPQGGAEEKSQGSEVERNPGEQDATKKNATAQDTAGRNDS